MKTIKFAPDWSGVLGFATAAAIGHYFGAEVAAGVLAFVAIAMMFKLRA